MSRLTVRGVDQVLESGVSPAAEPPGTRDFWARRVLIGWSLIAPFYAYSIPSSLFHGCASSLLTTTTTTTTTTMASFAIKDHSSAASMPSSTSAQQFHNFSPVTLFSFTSNGSATWMYTTVAIVLSLLVLEQSVYRYKKRHLPGDKWTIPIIGKFADSMRPTMEGYMKQWNSGALSAISVFNMLVVILRFPFIFLMDSKKFHRHGLIQRILAQNPESPMYAEPCLVHSAKAILQPDNWVFLTGKEHVEFRRILNTLFTRKALRTPSLASTSLNGLPGGQGPQSPAHHDDLALPEHGHVLRVFCGNHLPEQASIEISESTGHHPSLELVNFPLAIPGTKVYKAIQARKIAMNWLELAARNSKIAIANGAEPECLIDHWMSTISESSYKGRCHEQRLNLWIPASCRPPDILAKVREEQERVRQGHYDSPITIEQLDQMPYLQAFVKESLRVPYKTTKAFPISDDYVVPNGSMLIPSFYNSLHDPEVFPNLTS
ncbi:RNA polymerase C-22 sterol desaturase [Salix suchowensis]|nr:RNA polymerase C-22 sterol desaturase [Salix suchowensis]